MTMERRIAIRPTEESVAYTPQEVVENATTQAKLLMSIVEQTGCYQEISGKKYLQVEAWETIGAFNRTHAETESILPIVVDGKPIGYQAHVQLWKDGVVVGGAIMPCYFTENCCKGKEGDAKHKASMSAAQTFATSKAYRMNFSYVAILAGYQPLPAEEITEDMRGEGDKGEHWCSQHNTFFFKRGKMKSYAHPVEGTKDWCHQATKAVEQPPSTPATETHTVLPASPVASAPSGGSEAPPESHGHPGAREGQATTRAVKPPRDPATVKNYGELLKACHADFGMQPKTVYSELGVTMQAELTELAPDCYRRIAAVYAVEQVRRA